MARAESTDYLQNFRFHVTSGIPSNLSYIPKGLSEAGFNSVTIPEITVEAQEYREGTTLYTRKYPGPPTFGEITLSRGITKLDTTFYDWTKRAGTSGDYRDDITIHHFHRAEAPSASLPNAGRKLFCHECLPIRCKPDADLDATSGEVSLVEVDLALEWFEFKISD